MIQSSWHDCTSITDTRIQWRWINTSWRNCSYAGISYTNIKNTEEYKKKIKELAKKIAIQKMKDSWQEKMKEFKIIPKIRPAAQLRGVSFSGRGWA